MILAARMLPRLISNRARSMCAFQDSNTRPPEGYTTEIWGRVEGRVEVYGGRGRRGRGRGGGGSATTSEQLDSMVEQKKCRRNVENWTRQRTK